jgi:hypothetical protein
MIVIKNHQPCEDPINYLGFEELSYLGKDCIFFYGGHANDLVFNHSDKPKYFFSTEEQSWDLDTTDNFLNYVDTIFTICPPSITNRKKRKYVFFPFNEKHIPEDTEKIYDVIYCGLATGNHVTEILSTIKNFNYRFISFINNGITTNTSPTYVEKLKLISQSKITVVHNLTGTGTTQIKTRPFEAAFSKSLILCKKDQWNIIEEWFEPNKDFIYYEDSKELEFLITKIINNYEEYYPIIESAYNKSINNYTTKHFIQKFLS